MPRPYRPSNGTEGDFFISNWCDNCKHDSEEAPCEVRGRTYWYSIGDPEYPVEWIVDDDGISNPRCTAFVEITSGNFDTEVKHEPNKK